MGIVASAVESAMKTALAADRCDGGEEWFNKRPEQLRIVLRAATTSAQILTNDRLGLRDLRLRSVIDWFKEIGKVRDNYIEREEDDPKDIEDLPFLGPLELIAETLTLPILRPFNFGHYLLTWDDGMWMRWAFERLGKRMPSDDRLRSYLEADRFLEDQGFTCAGNISQRFIEWSLARKLSQHEVECLVAIWNKFVPLYNAIQL
jgi:hypothetical protein